MPRKPKIVYQFKIVLKGISPPIWRRIQVPENYTFWDLHVAIQDAMGWLDCHLHKFDVINPETALTEEIGIPVEDFGGDMEVLPGWKRKIAHYFSTNDTKADYLYDFGDHWTHEISFEGIQPGEKGVRYPACVAGKRACPPEDCGGIWGYQNFLEAVTDPVHKEHKEMIEWVGGKFDPEHFDVKAVRFDDPNVRWKIAFEED